MENLQDNLKTEHITQNIHTQSNLDEIKSNLPQYFDKDGNFDLEKFQKDLEVKDINFSKESYGMDWLGKSYARLLATDSTSTLLKEDVIHNQKEINQNSENLLIKGDNLEVLKHLSKAYNRKIKMIYIDPPYNTGTDGFVYQDDRKYTPKEFTELAGVSLDKAKRILDFTKGKSNSHSAWLTFMYPRLYIARQLLKDDGVIFISIDDNEVAQLRLLMDEIFGEENFVAEIINIVKTEGRRYGSFAKTHEYVLSYSKKESNLNQLDRLEEFKYEDQLGKFRLTDLRNQNTRAFNITNRPNLHYPFYIDEKTLDINGFFKVNIVQDINYNIEVYPIIIDGLKSVWRWGKEKSSQNQLDNLVAKKGTDNIYRIYQKYRSETLMPKTVWHDKNFISNKGTKEVQEIFNGNNVFDFPKPIGFILNFLNIGSNENDIILDFFAGSGTTGDAVMQLNAEDGSNRKYILVQIPEPIDEKKNKASYDFVKNELEVLNPTIFEITKERLIRAANKIKKETESKLNYEENNLDLGFKIFETTPIWDNYKINSSELNNEIVLFDSSALDNEDLMTLLTTWKVQDGIPLNQDFEIIDLDGYNGHYFDNKLYLMYRGFEIQNLISIHDKIENSKTFNPANIIIFGYNFESARLLEISGSLKVPNKKDLKIELIVRY